MKNISNTFRLSRVFAPSLVAFATLFVNLQTSIAQSFTENMCSALDDRKDFAGLQNYCQQWMNQDPTNWTAVDYLAVSFYERQMYPQAIQCFRKAIALRPEIAFTYKQLALAEGYGGRFDHTNLRRTKFYSMFFERMSTKD